MALEDLRMENKNLDARIFGIVKLVLAFVCGLALFWEHGSTPYGIQISAQEKGIIVLLDYFIIALFLGKNLLMPFLSRGSGGYIRGNFIEILLSLVLFLFIITSSDGFYEYPLLAVKVLCLTIYPYRVFVMFLARIRVNTPLTVAFSFLTVIIAGMLLFLLPKSTVAGDMKAIDALFTSTSATCVTGLIVVDTGSYFSPFGQAVLLALIQIGGLGLMTFMAFFSLALGRGLGLRQEVFMKDALSLEHRFGLRRVIVFILGLTFVVEAAGAVAIYLSFPFRADYAIGEKVWFSVFHSISAFCNSGFSLLSGSFMSARGSIGLNLTISGLIIIGGLGFIVCYNILSRIKSGRHVHKISIMPRETSLEKLRHFGVHTRIVIITTIALLAAGTFVVYLIEHTRSFAQFPEGEKWLASFFQSVTARTAGFNTVDTSALSAPTLLITVILMFIGASPGSTGGGIKTSTFALFVLLIYSRLRNRRSVEFHKRTIPQRVIFNAIVVVVLALVIVLVSTIVLTVTEEDKDFLGVLFEVVSAFGTVGLSTGITPALTVAGKVTIIITMFVGRIGPLTLMLAMSAQEATKRYSYPDETLMIG